MDSLLKQVTTSHPIPPLSSHTTFMKVSNIVKGVLVGIVLAIGFSSTSPTLILRRGLALLAGTCVGVCGSVTYNAIRDKPVNPDPTTEMATKIVASTIMTGACIASCLYAAW